MTSPDAVSIARELGVCEPGKPGSLALLGPGDHAAPYPSCRAKACNHKANRVAYFSSHLFDAASIYRRRTEDHAGTAASLDDYRRKLFLRLVKRAAARSADVNVPIT